MSTTGVTGGSREYDARVGQRPGLLGDTLCNDIVTSH